MASPILALVLEYDTRVVKLFPLSIATSHTVI
jgi:hypothetical protein